MDKARFELGLTQRKATLGADYVEKNLAAADEFTTWRDDFRREALSRGIAAATVDRALADVPSPRWAVAPRISSRLGTNGW